MAISYTRLGAGGEILLQTENAYSAFTNDEGELFVRPSENIIRIAEGGEIWVTAPVEVETPRDPDTEARVG